MSVIVSSMISSSVGPTSSDDSTVAEKVAGDTIGGSGSVHHLHGPKEDAVSHHSGLHNVALMQIDPSAPTWRES